MLTHDQIWAAIDALAATHGLSASGLARRAGLDPTTFNKSKRLTPDGRQRWPSTESIAKILIATGASLDEFVALVTQAAVSTEYRLPLIGSAEAAERVDIASDRDLPADGWSEIALGAVSEPKAFALDINGKCDTGLYREGDVLIVVPGAAFRRGDRLVLRLRSGALVIGEVKRETADTLDLARTGPSDEPRAIRRADLSWTARVYWASQ